MRSSQNMKPQNQKVERHTFREILVLQPPWAAGLSRFAWRIRLREHNYCCQLWLEIWD